MTPTGPDGSASEHRISRKNLLKATGAAALARACAAPDRSLPPTPVCDGGDARPSTHHDRAGPLPFLWTEPE
ncbi:MULTISPECIES: hypothetical protein [unclassified Streptomyces]|uniref:hypothetical protein n=1 Tax=unclassified Streptomyces TaxID=2593676 RepID=UPI00341579D4